VSRNRLGLLPQPHSKNGQAGTHRRFPSDRCVSTPIACRGLEDNPACAFGVLLYTLAAGICYSAFQALALELVGADNPVASTQYSLFLAASNAAIVYMTWIDGRAYKYLGLKGFFAVDAGASILAGFVFLFLLREKLARSVIIGRTVPVRIPGRGGVVLNVTVEVETLGIAVVRVGHGCGLRCPVLGDESAETAAVVPCPEHIQPGFAVAFFAGELVDPINAAVRHMRESSVIPVWGGHRSSMSDRSDEESFATARCLGGRLPLDFGLLLHPRFPRPIPETGCCQRLNPERK
jgi:hypothetical protein